MSPLSLRSRPGAGSFHSAAPDFLHRRSPYEATCRLIASRLRRSMGLVRWPAKPASRLRRISSSLPNPLLGSGKGKGAGPFGTRCVWSGVDG